MQKINISTREKILAVVLGAFLLILMVYITSPKTRVDDMPGDVRGENPQNIPESDLPICNFTGAEFVELPCYSPPGSYYL